MKARMRIAYQSDPEYRAKLCAQKRKTNYDQRKYGMAEEYKDKKNEENTTNTKMESESDRSGRRKTLEQVVKVH